MTSKMYRLFSGEQPGNGRMNRWYGNRLALAGSVRTPQGDDIVSADSDIG